MAFTKLFSSVRLLYSEENFGRIVLRNCSAKLEAPACDKNEDKSKTHKGSSGSERGQKVD